MYLIRILRWLRSYVKFAVRKGPAERLMNLCAHSGIVTWDCRKTKDGMTGCTSVNDYCDMRPLARQAGVATRVVERHGAKFVVHRYRRRLGIAAGVAVFLALLCISQQFVWQIRIEGREQADEKELLAALEDLGVHCGMRKGSVDQRQVAREIQLKVDDLSWAALNFYGTTAILRIRERTVAPPKIDTNIPANVVASQDAQIKRLQVYDGKAALREGDTVRAGEIIVSGVWEDQWGVTHLIRANADVYAHVPKTLTITVPLEQDTCVLTGEIKKRNYLEVFGIRLPLFIYTELSGDYKLERNTASPMLFGAQLPFALSQEHYIFYDTQTQSLSKENALQIAQRRLQAAEKREFGDAPILSREVKAAEEKGALVLRANYEIEMNIAKQVDIPVLERNKPVDPAKIREGGY